MKNIYISLLACVSMLLATTSCSDKPTELKISPITTALKGDLSDYYEVVDKEYKVESGFAHTIIVEIKRNNTPFAFDVNDVDPYGTYGTSSDKKVSVGFGIETFDEQGNPVYIYNPTEGNMYDDTKALIKLPNGESGFISMSLFFEGDQAEKAKTFKISSIYNINEDSDDSDDATSNSSTSEVSTTSDNNWDSVIDDYEEFIDNYIVLLKKAKAGDASAMTEYASMLANAQNLQGKLSNAQSSLSTAQAARFSKIMTKMASAAASM